MKSKKAITEESGEHRDWMKRAKAIKTPQELGKFVEELTTAYDHDYGTICHAIAAAAIAGAHAVERSPCGGITGFQAGAVMWEMIKGWGVWGDGPLEMVEWSNLLYPQYDNRMPRTISKEQFERLREKAKAFDHGSPATNAVKNRMSMIADGQLPKWLEFRAD